MKNRKSFIKDLSRKQILEIKACTLCRECLKYCPVQEVTKDPDISPPEKIRLYREFIESADSLRARLFGPAKLHKRLLEDFTKAVFECTTCGSCGEVCPVGIDTQMLWPMLRKEMVRKGLGPIGVQKEIPEMIRKTGNPYGKPSEDRFRQWFPEGMTIVDKAELAYYAGCTGAYEAQPMVRGDVLVLNAIGEPFTMLSPEEEVCCGFPLFISGQHDMLEDVTKSLVNAYKAKGVKTLLCSCPCCVNIMSKDWPVFYGEKLPFRIVHITQFVSDALRSGKLRITRKLEEKVIYHDPCYLSRGVGVIEEPRAVLRSIPGIELIEFERNRRNSRCCGAGGAARKVFHENAIAIGRLSIDEAAEKHADRLVLSCPACYEKVNEAMEGYDKKIKIVDIMELVSEVL